MTTEQVEQSVGAPAQMASMVQNSSQAWINLVQVLARVPLQVTIQNLTVATELLDHTNHALQQGLENARQLVAGGRAYWHADREDLRDRSTARATAMANLGPSESFYFRGPAQNLNLPAENLARFLDAAAQVDDATWLYHLRRGDYARWFREVLQDEILSAEADWLAQQGERTAAASRDRLRAAIEQRYLWPA